MRVRQEEVAGQPHEVSVLVGRLFVNGWIEAKVKRGWHFFRLPDVQVSEYMQQRGRKEQDMGMTQGEVAVGIFTNPVQARQAVDELRRAGYSDDEIGYLTRASANRPSEDTGTFIANSAVEGGLVGGLIGAAAALFIPGLGPVLAGGILAAALGGAAIGAAASGIIAALVNIGVPEDEA